MSAATARPLVCMVFDGDTGNSIDSFDYTAEELERRAKDLRGVVTLEPTDLATPRRWLIRVAQEYAIEAETADLAFEIAGVMERRTFQGIPPLTSRAVLAPIEEDEPDAA